MRKAILDNIKTGLESEVGLSSIKYSDLKIEDIQTRLPEKVTVNYFLGIGIERADSVDKEIGQYHPSMKRYECFVVVYIASADYDSGQEELDTIVNRVTKYFARDYGNLGGLIKEVDGVREQVVSHSIEDYNYIPSGGDGTMAHVCAIRISIRTNLTI